MSVKNINFSKLDFLGEKANFKVISFEQWREYGKGKTCPLFDGLEEDNWNSYYHFYFCSPSHYIEIEVFDDFNVWRYGSQSYPSYNAKLKIEYFNNNEYIDVTNNYKQETTVISKWEKTIWNLPKGRYKFSLLDSKKNRMDIEWFLEKIVIDKYLLKQNNKYYTLHEDFYNKDKNVFTPLNLINIDDNVFEKYGMGNIKKLTQYNSNMQKPIDFFKDKGELKLIKAKYK